MIDLRYAGLPSALEVGGISYDIDTDFRTWLAWIELAETHGLADMGIFVGDRPEGDAWVGVAMDFARNDNLTPRNVDGTRGIREIDLIEDGEYIVGAFQQAYGIDLTDPCLEMHWHRFQALLRSLPSDTKMSEIMGYRCYRPSKRKPEQVYADQRRAWALPAKKAAAGSEMMEWQQRAFGNIR